MGLAHQILAQRQFNEIVNRFNHPAIDSTCVNPNTCSPECLDMLRNEGFVIREGQLGTHYISLPKKHNGGGYYYDYEY